ncbi:MAG TPA: amino acid adenylation domain-containing protein [Candidatus Bathyarchaeia archaeon]|nr:amino acid adenylation domain-containing protein [Candidatus Bathyarchaeia archaeon]
MIVDTFGLTSVQHGMLYNHLAGGQRGVDIEQFVIGYPEPPDILCLERAWQLVGQRHPALRTSFHWGDGAAPFQAVHDYAPIALTCRHAAVSGEELNHFLREDRVRGFDLTQPPLARLTYFPAPNGACVLVWTVHHILVDGRAILIVLSEVEDFYHQLLAGREVSVDAGPSFRPYVEWLQAQDASRHRAFWTEYLKPFVAPTPVPEDPHLANAFSSCYSGQERRLSVNLSSKLREIAASNGVTLNTIAMAAWGILLARYSGQKDVLFGASKSSRKSSVSKADSIVGLFLNTLPVRLSVPSDKPLRAILQEVRADWLALRDHEHVPLAQIKAASSMPVSSVLFESLVVFEHARLNRVLARTYPQWQDRTYLGLGQPNFALTLSVFANPKILLKLEFDPQRFSNRRINALLGHLEQIFAALADDPSASVSSINQLPINEQQQVVVEWNSNPVEYPCTPLHVLVEERAAGTPEAVAVTFGEQSLTYADLNASANQLAAELRQQGAGPRQLVGVCAERSLGMMVALLAILKSGAAYVPIDPHLPADRVRYMIEDSGLPMIIADEVTLPALESFEGTLIDLHGQEWRQNGQSNVKVSVSPEDIAYVIYTSGSTGKPKGVEVPRRALNNLLYAVRDWFEFGQQDCLLAVATIAFDISGVDIWLPWLVGARTILASREDAIEGQKLRSLIERHNVTFLQATPLTWRLLLNSGWPGGDVQAICTGEAMPQELASALRPKVRRLWNMYGPTETTVWSTGYNVRDAAGPVLIGRPIANTRCYILDEQRRPVPIGAVGELCISGEGLALGYLKRPELTREKFVTDPYHQGQRMYVTGDLARYDHDGNIECLGRIDRQVKIRGFRIEPGEIEAALEEQPEVRQAVVVAREDQPGMKRLIAYLVCDSIQPTTAELRRSLKQRLPDYMIPSDFVELDEFPYTVGGKIDVAALPAPEASASVPDAVHVPPLNAIERQIADIWQEVLGIAPIGVSDDFFDMGGDSLLSIHAVLRIREALEVELSAADMGTASNVARLASLVAERQHARCAEWLIPVCNGSSKEPLFVAPSVFLDNEYYLAKHLSEKLGPEQTVHCFRLPDIKTKAQFDTVESLAAHCAEVMTRTANGPFHLLGYSMGGIVAYEIARALEASGRKVQTLAITDTGPRSLNRGFEPFQHFPTFASNLVRLVIYRTRRGDLNHAISGTVRKLRDVVTGVSKTPVGRLNQYLDPFVIEQTPQDLRNAMQRRFVLWEQHVPGPYNGKVLLFRAKLRPLYRGLSSDLGWGRLARGGVEVIELPGAHAHIPGNEECLTLISETIAGSIDGMAGANPTA